MIEVLILLGLILWCLGFFSKNERRNDPAQYARAANVNAELMQCELIEKKQLKPNIYNFKFRLPSYQSSLGFKPGQTIQICETIKTIQYPYGEEVIREYSPTSGINQKGHFDLIIKVYRANENSRFPDGGKLTSWIVNLNLGDQIHITKPGGRFIYKGQGIVEFNKFNKMCFDQYNRIFMVAGGSKIIRIIQIIRAVANNKDDKTKLELLYANKSEDDILFYNELKDYHQKKKLILHLTLDRIPQGWSHSQGYVTKIMIEKEFSQIKKKTLVLHCGSETMNGQVRTIFQQLGVQPDEIFEF